MSNLDETHSARPNKDVSEEDAITIKRTERVRFREMLVGWTQVGSNLLVPFALAVAGFGLLQDNWRDRSDESTRQIELFYSENLGHAQSVLFALWSNVDLTVLRSPQSRSFIDAFVERTIEASPRDPGEITAALVNVASYFDRVERCIRAKRCDETELLDQLGQYGRDFHCIYSGQLAAVRENTLVFALGEGLEGFAERAGGCER